MWFFLVKSIVGAILGQATNSWFRKTKMGNWFYKKVDIISSWAAKKLNIRVLEKEEAWKKKYPNVAKRIADLEERIERLEEN